MVFGRVFSLPPPLTAMCDAQIYIYSDSICTSKNKSATLFSPSRSLVVFVLAAVAWCCFCGRFQKIQPVPDHPNVFEPVAIVAMTFQPTHNSIRLVLETALQNTSLAQIATMHSTSQPEAAQEALASIFHRFSPIIRRYVGSERIRFLACNTKN